MTAPPSLHVPDEPTARAESWLAAVVEGGDLTDVLRAEDGLIHWLWTRWSSLEKSGVTFEGFSEIVIGYRRELWLWLAGERTWAHTCSGLLGRVARRMAGPVTTAG